MKIKITASTIIDHEDIAQSADDALAVLRENNHEEAFQWLADAGEAGEKSFTISCEEVKE